MWEFQLLAAAMVAHVLLSKFTKVEESFNLQAVHDFLHYGPGNLSLFDHFEFPGVVHRSGIGAAFIAALSWPLVWLNNLLFVSGFTSSGKAFELVLIRLVIGAVFLVAFRNLLNSIRSRFGHGVARFYVLVTFSNFHLLYYASRTLPNSFALILVVQALAHLLSGNRLWIPYFIFAIVVFRIDLILLFGPLLLANGLVSAKFPGIVTYCLKWGILSLASTVLFDSWFWGNWVWPELSSIVFNLVQNKSNLYGTQPFPYYFTVVLPKLLMLSYPLIFTLTPQFMIRYRSELLRLLLPTLVFTFAYSFLPHKELRFILYAPLIFNLVAAFRMHSLWNLNKSLFAKLVVVAILVVNFCLTGGFLLTSSLNYPGGHAAQHFNNVIAPSISSSNITVHIDTYTAMTGFSRFSQEYDHTPWLKYHDRTIRYDKNESLTLAQEYRQFDYLILSVHLYRNLGLDSHFSVVHTEHGFGGLGRSKSLTLFAEYSDERLKFALFEIWYPPLICIAKRNN